MAKMAACESTVHRFGVKDFSRPFLPPQPTGCSLKKCAYRSDSVARDGAMTLTSGGWHRPGRERVAAAGRAAEGLSLSLSMNTTAGLSGSRLPPPQPQHACPAVVPVWPLEVLYLGSRHLSPLEV